MNQEHELIIFDADGTLCKPFTDELLDGVEEFFHLLFEGDDRPYVAIASNQGGVGLRRSLEMQDDGLLGWAIRLEKYSHLPTRREAEDRLASVDAAIFGATTGLRIYCCFVWIDKEGNHAALPPEAEGDIRWNPAWRKPSPGMLLQAMRDADVLPSETLFVGDRPEDQAAAAAAGCSFRWADEFFGRQG